MKKSLLTVATVALSLFLASTISLAHSGRTDSAGGHRDNKNVSGLGSYHYHHGYSAHLHPNGVCPYTVTSTPAATSSSSTPAPTTSTSKSTPQTVSPATPSTANTDKKQSPEVLVLKAASKTPKPAFTSIGLKTDSEKAIFLDNYIAILTTSDVYHTIDCEDFDKYSKFDACDVSKALERGYRPCSKCH